MIFCCKSVTSELNSFVSKFVDSKQKNKNKENLSKLRMKSYCFLLKLSSADEINYEASLF